MGPTLSNGNIICTSEDVILGSFYIFIYINVIVRMYISEIYIYTRMYVFLLCIFICIHVRLCIYSCIYTFAHIYIYIYAQLRCYNMCVCIYVICNASVDVRQRARWN